MRRNLTVYRGGLNAKTAGQYSQLLELLATVVMNVLLEGVAIKIAQHDLNYFAPSSTFSIQIPDDNAWKYCRYFNRQRMGENISAIATAKSEYQRKHKIRAGDPEWFKLWFAQPKLTGENPMPKNKA